MEKHKTSLYNSKEVGLASKCRETSRKQKAQHENIKNTNALSEDMVNI